MSVRRVVAARKDGKDGILADGAAPRHHDFEHIPQMAQTLVWATGPNDDMAAASVDRSTEVTSLVPEPGGTLFFKISFPPQTVMQSADFDPQAAGAEQAAAQPGLAELFDPDSPGKHRTPTIDYVVVTEGEIYLELDDEETKLVAGDVLVQVGTRHSWSVRTDGPATIAAIVIGARESD
jgi:hypothetical protein